jgi:hypothetical protein
MAYVSGFTSTAATENLVVGFNSSKTWTSISNVGAWTGYYETNCNGAGNTIATLYASGRAFNFIGGASRWQDVAGFTYLTANNVGVGVTVSSSAKLEVAGQISATTISASTVQPRASTQTCTSGIRGAIDYKSIIPSGAVMAFDLPGCPAGWSEYTAARGRFLRGIDNGAGNDPAGTRAPGTTQADLVGPHTHTFNAYTGGVPRTIVIQIAGGASHSQADQTTAANSGVETRPKNVAVLFCRKD